MNAISITPCVACAGRQSAAPRELRQPSRPPRSRSEPRSALRRPRAGRRAPRPPRTARTIPIAASSWENYGRSRAMPPGHPSIRTRHVHATGCSLGCPNTWLNVSAFPRRAGVAKLVARRALTPRMIRVTLRSEAFGATWPIEQPGEIITLLFAAPGEVVVPAAGRSGRSRRAWSRSGATTPCAATIRWRARSTSTSSCTSRAVRLHLGGGGADRRRRRLRRARASTTRRATGRRGCCCAATRRRCRRSPRSWSSRRRPSASWRSSRWRTPPRSSRSPPAPRCGGCTATAPPPRPRPTSPTRCASCALPDGTGQAWGAAESKVARTLREVLRDERGMERKLASAKGYWLRSGEWDDDDD